MAILPEYARLDISLPGRTTPSLARMLIHNTSKPIRLRLPEKRSYDIEFGSYDALPVSLRVHNMRVGKCLIVTDQNVARLYATTIEGILNADGWETMVLVLPVGEQTKSEEHLKAIYDAALSWGIDRQTPIFAIGGGVIGDLAGFAAATLLRGIPIVQIPTTLIAQVDSALGGKTGINHELGKNLIGAFHQPSLVFTNPQALYTLSQRDWHSGLAEVVKHALIADSSFFEWIADDLARIVARDPAVVTPLVYRAASIKATVVSKDERESGVRALLNYGHTFGHALENAAGYGVFTHGEAVTIGMEAALFLSRRYNRKVDHIRAGKVLEQLPRPEWPAGLSVQSLIDAMATDKKKVGADLKFVLLKEIGRAYVASGVTSSDIESAWTHVSTRL